MKRIHYYQPIEGEAIGGLTLTEVKKRIRKSGGSGYTVHMDRDGSTQETTPISLGNNGVLTYNARYNDSRVYHRPEPIQKPVSIDWGAVLAAVTQEAKEKKLGEEDHLKILRLLKQRVPDATRLTDSSLYAILCQVHGALFHEYHGFFRYGRMVKAIHAFKASGTD